jgi:hypothetical protein
MIDHLPYRELGEKGLRKERKLVNQWRASWFFEKRLANFAGTLC